MATDFKAGLDSDELNGLPSAANPLTAMGIDPDGIMKNPDILDAIRTGAYDPLNLQSADERHARAAQDDRSQRETQRAIRNGFNADRIATAVATGDIDDPRDKDKSQASPTSAYASSLRSQYGDSGMYSPAGSDSPRTAVRPNTLGPTQRSPSDNKFVQAAQDDRAAQQLRRTLSRDPRDIVNAAAYGEYTGEKDPRDEDLNNPPKSPSPSFAASLKNAYSDTVGASNDTLSPPVNSRWLHYLDTPQVKGAPVPASASPTGGAGTATPSSAVPSTPEEYEKAGMQSLYENAQSATKAAGEVPTQTPQEITDLTARRAKLAAPAPRFDKTTGKELTSTQEYDPDTGQMITVNPKASKAQKVWRGVRGGLVGLGTQGFTGAVRGAFNPEEIPGGTAYNAPSKAYQQAEGRREQALSTTDTNIDNARKNWVEAVKARQARAGEFRSNATLGKDLASAAENSTKNTINQFKADATADNYKTKADEASNKLQEQMQKDLQTAQTNEQRIQILRDNASMADQLHRSQLEFAKQKLDTTTDARTIDQWQKEQLDSVNKDYNGILSSVWNRIRWGSKQDLIGKINIAADARRAAVGLGTGAAQPKPAPATATASTPPAKGYTRIKASDGNLHDIPSDKLAAAQQRDPKLSVVGAGK